MLSLLEPSRRDGVALLVLQQLLGCLEELVADVALEHPGDEVDLEVALVHAVRLAHEVAEDALESCRGRVPLLTAFVGLLVQLEGQKNGCDHFLVKIHLGTFDCSYFGFISFRNMLL